MKYFPLKPTLVLFIACWVCSGVRGQSKWYRGNTHAHTVLCGHADTAPAAVAQWYLDHGYHFLILSEHNRFIDPDSVALPPGRSADFILVPGEEVTGKQVIHTTAMNIRAPVGWEFDSPKKSEIIQNHVNGVRAAGGQPILNHPNFRYAVSAADIRPVRHLYLFELFNGHPAVNNEGDDEHPSTEEIWDILLTDGMMIYGVSSDDAHHFQAWDANHSNPGRGWVMVRAPALTPAAVTAAMRNGDFYASNGVFLDTVEISPGGYTIAVDEARTRREVDLPTVSGRKVEEGTEGFTIEFIGPGGKVLKSVAGLTARFEFDQTLPYVRGRVTFIRTHPDRGREAFFAWTQPRFAGGE